MYRRLGAITLGQSLSISPDGKRIATIGFPTHIHMQVLDLEKGEKMGDPILKVTMPIAFLPDGRHVVAKRTDRLDQPGLVIWDIENRKQVLALRGTFGSGMLAISADGRFAALVESGGSISVWEMPKL